MQLSKGKRRSVAEIFSYEVIRVEDQKIFVGPSLSSYYGMIYLRRIYWMQLNSRF
jgi:hypothetical protein